MGGVFMIVMLGACLILGGILSLFPKSVRIAFLVVLFFMLIFSWSAAENSNMNDAYMYALFVIPLIAGSFIGLGLIELFRYIFKSSKKTTSKSNSINQDELDKEQ